MAHLSTYAANKLIDALLRDVAYVSTPTYVALFTTKPTMPAGTGGVEVANGAYVRVRLDTALAAAANGSTSNNAVLSWPQATASWGTIVGVGVYDAPTGGNLLTAGDTAWTPVATGDTFSLPVSGLLTALN